VYVALACVPPGCVTDASNAFDLFTTTVLLIDGTSTAATFTFVETSGARTGTGFTWRITCDANASLPYMNVFRATTMFLGTPPVITAVFPTTLSFLGSTIVTVTTAWSPASHIAIPPNSNASCVFSYLHPVSDFVSSIATKATGDDRSKTCVSPAIPEFALANLSVTLQDGRRSQTPFRIVSSCPNSYYVENATKCVHCPDSAAGSSFNELTNAPSVQSCRCGVGSYGTFGYGCKRCPPRLKGFNCSSPDQPLPIINPGFWGDSSLLPKCDVQADACPAIATCPYGEKACPGGADKLCTTRDDACYEGRACVRCCPKFYLESQSCIPCPDQSTLTLILAIVCVVVVILAIFVSTASSPSATQSTKYVVLGMNFFQGIGAIKLINIEWPPIILKMFEIMQYFSFSISVVRPECAFSWSFELKVSITLLLPILLSFLLCSYGVYKSGYSCWRLYRTPTPNILTVFLHQFDPISGTETSKTCGPTAPSCRSPPSAPSSTAGHTSCSSGA
jgi:hypothetical protein